MLKYREVADFLIGEDLESKNIKSLAFLVSESFHQEMLDTSIFILMGSSSRICTTFRFN